MELFKPFRKLSPILVGYNLLAKYGISAPSASQKYLCRFTSLFGYFALGCGFILGYGFIAYEANTFQEFSDVFYGFITLINDAFYFVYMPWFCRNAFELNKQFVDVIKER